ncbi:PDR/VanB family oxidoreductase [Lentzea californiensis]|uniref:PDR/VanB family oxidoreductase n=1 Tax=Lentzea californiensis TaxID=438851 RepID=UPI0021664B1E|nr:PDR/VanB family oxidoreductase [Lentzea californiensis]MCR3750699.1 Ferredoxin-NADP reductase [Lentzea californiensis]
MGDLIDLVVTEKSAVAHGVTALTLRHPEGRRLPDWSPGAHLDLVLPNGMVRQYSLCGDRWDSGSYRVAVLREPSGRGGSAFVHDRLRCGDRMAASAPRNNFRLAPAPSYLFIAGGIGITPLLPMIHQAALLGVGWHLLYGGRNLGSMAFRDELAGHGDRVTVVPQDELGLLDLPAHLPPPGPDTQIYCCGPAPLLEALQRLTAGYPAGQVRTERFVPAAETSAARDEPFEVELRRTGVTVVVTPRQSVLDAINAVGATVLSSCRQGTCGTCETAVIEGRPEHRDSILDDSERAAADCLFPCVSRSGSGRLVLDA